MSSLALISGWYYICTLYCTPDNFTLDFLTKDGMVFSQEWWENKEWEVLCWVVSRKVMSSNVTTQRP